ncbi:MAG: transglycosylase SLT domain-containing protein [Proteobacteria bacterium]|nr:transglycosylase SLT domain-containing protein [Pseudomonadota bacterium]MBU1649735.1 transglycosylase SLT domain-containing protein [Pseudomonadota bacterium]MBU1985783.1 transglycosylase SLT domain-containing protein [Pseudomonadota bacterium]
MAKRSLNTFAHLFIACALLLIPVSGHSELLSSINKYKDVNLSTERLNKISRYHGLIEYFAGFTFFQPRHKVSPDFIRALILAESDANPRAISSKNARGLGQIIPNTGIEAGLELSKGTVDFHNVSRSRLSNLSEEDLYDPEVNILLTCYLIAKYNYKFKGHLALVLSAWNAGENIKELKQGQYAPYQETHELIGKVNGYYLCLLQQKKTRMAYNR